jgi:pyruvate,water dikinase
MAGDSEKKFILWFKEIGITDVPLVGGKNASLGEMYQKLESKGIRVPNGFAITAYAYRYFLKYAGIEDEIKKILKNLDTHDLRKSAKLLRMLKSPRI